MTDLQRAIVSEISTALERLDAPAKLRAAVGSWGDTLDEASVLEALKEWNESGDIAFAPIPPSH